jgi:glycosyltransferase involved in cell wall biosynthesis
MARAHGCCRDIRKLGKLVYFTPVCHSEFIGGSTSNYYDDHFRNLASVTGALDVLSIGYAGAEPVCHPRVTGVRLWPEQESVRSFGQLWKWARLACGWLKETSVLYVPFVEFHPAVCASQWQKLTKVKWIQRMTWSPVKTGRASGEELRRRLMHLLAERFVFRSADWLGAGSAALAEHAVAGGMPRGRIQLTTNFIDDSGLPRKSDYDLRKPPHIVSVGRLVELKQIDDVIRALRGLDVLLTVIGDGPERPALERLVQELSVRAIFLGRVPNQLIGGYLAASDVFVTASRVEAVPKALLEAMAVGLPCVAYGVEGVRDWLSDGRGLTVPPSPEELRIGVQRLVSDRPLRERIGEAAAAYARHAHSRDAAMSADRRLVGCALQSERRA